MEKLNKLIEACKGSVTIEVNYHRGIYQSVPTYISELSDDEKDEIGADIYDKMCKTDTIIRIAFYPRTQNSFYVCWHYDLEEAIQECLDTAISYTRGEIPAAKPNK